MPFYFIFIVLMKQHQSPLLSVGFIAGLLLLLLNDFYLKANFGNAFTGKLSDVAGLFIFPLFWAVFFPAHKKVIYLSTALFFRQLSPQNII